ncbi:MAG TPA: hypothetical protein VFL27_12865 [Candidatus Dormibacteraeota bacterium]|nr:hypothetical protein [Candidatus Dormibacteraeota bacterium]
MLTDTQKGAAGEQLLAAAVTLTSDGDLELFKPLSDDDHTDVSVGRRGRVPALAVQVKTALKVDHKGLAVARMYFSSGTPREHPAFVYAVVYVVDASIAAAWLVPSIDFNRLSYRGKGKRGKGLELQFMASPTRVDRWTPFRCARLETGPRLLAIIDALPATRVPRVAGAHLVLLRQAGKSRGVLTKPE